MYANANLDHQPFSGGDSEPLSPPVPRTLASNHPTTNHPPSSDKQSSLSCKSPSTVSGLATSITHVTNGVNYDSSKDGCAGSASVDSLPVRVPEGKSNITVLPSKNSRHRKEAGIPVGIAVAWQRLVTSSSTSATNTNTTTVACSGKSSPPLVKPSKVKSSKLLSPSLPKRPLSSASAPGAIPMKVPGEKSKTHGSKTVDLKSRPASVNSLPINPGVPAGDRNSPAYIEQQYAYSGGLSTPYTDWKSGLSMSHLPLNYSAATAAYLQQQHHFSMQQQQAQQQLQLTHGGPYGTSQLGHSYLYHGYSPEAVQKYEQYLHQSEYHHHRHQQELQYQNQLEHQYHLQQQEYELHRATPVPSPRINIPSPSPTIHPHSLWPPELFHHNSSTTLSPKSLASTPSPVTVQDSSNYLQQTTATPAKSNGTPVNLSVASKDYVFSSPFSPTTGLPPSKNPWKDIKINPVPKKLKKYDKIESPTLLDIAKLEEEVREDSSRGTVIVEKKKHDFKRLESLIEKRDEISVPLLNSGPESDSPRRRESKVLLFPGKDAKLDTVSNVQQKNDVKVNFTSDVVVGGGGDGRKQVPDDVQHSCLPFTDSKMELCSRKESNHSKEPLILSNNETCFNYCSKQGSGSREKCKKKIKATLRVKEESTCSSYLKPIESKCLHRVGVVDEGGYSGSDNTSVDLSFKSPLYTDVKPPLDISVTSKIKAEDKLIEPQVQRDTNSRHGINSLLFSNSVVVSDHNDKAAVVAEGHRDTISAAAPPPAPPSDDVKPSFPPVVNIKVESRSLQNGNDHVPVISKCTEDESLYLNRNLKPTVVESNSLATKCDTDIKVETTACSNNNNYNSSFKVVTSGDDRVRLEFSGAAVDAGSRPDAGSSKEYQQYEHQRTGNTNYLLNVPLPPLSVDRKFNFKSECSSASDMSPQDHQDLLVHRFHHHNFLPIEEENNHLDLLATVAQEFGNEIGLRKKPHLHTLDTYEFRDEVDDKIESFGQSQSLAGSVRSASVPVSKPIRTLLLPPISVAPAPSPVASVVLKIPQITASVGERMKKKKEKPLKTEKTARKRKEKAVSVSEENAGVIKVRKKKQRSESAEDSKGANSEEKLKIVKPVVKGGISSVCAFPVKEKATAMRKSKKQNIMGKDVGTEPEPGSNELKVMPLNLKKRRSTTDAIVMKKRNTKRSNSVSSCEYEIVQQPTKGRRPFEFTFSSQVQGPKKKKRKVASEKSKSSTFAKSNNFNGRSTSTNIIGGLEEGQSKQFKKKQNQPLQKPNALSQDLKLQISKKQKIKRDKLAVQSFTLSLKKPDSSEDTIVQNENYSSSISLSGPDKSTIVYTAPPNEKASFPVDESSLLFSPASSNAENDWATNPTHAVTAIKSDSEPSSSSAALSPYFIDISPVASPETKEEEDPDASRNTTKPSKLTLVNSNSMHNNNQLQSLSPTRGKKSEKSKFKSLLKPSVHFAPIRVNKQNGHHIKPCLKAEPVIRQTATSPEEDDFVILSEDEEKHLDTDRLDSLRDASECFVESAVSPTREVVRENGEDLRREDNIYSSEIISEQPASAAAVDQGQGNDSATQLPHSAHEKVVIEDVSEMLNEMRILTEIQGLFYTGKLNALQPPDVYGVTLDNERGAPPHLIFSAEEVLEKCIREIRPDSLDHGLRICAYWSPQYSGLYPGKISQDYTPSGDPQNELIPIEFDDGDTGVIKLNEIRLLATNHPIRAYDPNPLLTLEKKHRKRRHSSATGSQIGCNGDHEDADCGEPYCAKIAKLEEESAVHEKHSSRLMYWTWQGLGFKKSRSKKDRNKEFFEGIQRGDEIISVGDSALFISNGSDRPFIGRVEKFWEKKGQKIVHVRWFYHPDEVKTGKRPQGLYTGALFESPHIDENDVQTIAKKCQVLPFDGFKEKVGCLTKWSKHTSQREIYYIAGFYDPYTYNLQLKDLK